MRLLFVSPLPPPLHGHSLAGDMLKRHLTRHHCVEVIDSAMDKSFSGNSLPPIYSPKRIIKIAQTLISEFRSIYFKKYDAVYLSVGITFRGFMRYAPYMLSSIIKREPLIIHTHGSTFRTMYETQSVLKKRILKYFLKRTSAVIVLGKSLRPMFQGLVEDSRIYVCENGVQANYTFSKQELFLKPVHPIKILFLTNLMRAKGFLELVAAFKYLPEEYHLSLAGAVEPDAEIVTSLDNLLSEYGNRVIYYGVVDGKVKRDLLFESQIFVLPSKNEGQPISILEAYSAGLTVVTDQSIGGICDIFCGGVNGISCDSNYPQSIADAIKSAYEAFKPISETNYRYSTNFTEEMFCKRVENVIKAQVKV